MRSWDAEEMAGLTRSDEGNEEDAEGQSRQEKADVRFEGSRAGTDVRRKQMADCSAAEANYNGGFERCGKMSESEPQQAGERSVCRIYVDECLEQYTCLN